MQLFLFMMQMFLRIQKNVPESPAGKAAEQVSKENGREEVTREGNDQAGEGDGDGDGDGRRDGDGDGEAAVGDVHAETAEGTSAEENEEDNSKAADDAETVFYYLPKEVRGVTVMFKDENGGWR